MANTDTITPEERRMFAEDAKYVLARSMDIEFKAAAEAILRLLTALEAAEARAEKAEDYAEKLVYAVTDGNLSNSYDVQAVADEVSRIWQSYTNQKVAAVRAEAEAENARLRAERDWLVSWFDAHPCCMDLQCPFGRTLEQCEAREGGMLDSTECWQEAARRAVAGEG